MESAVNIDIMVIPCSRNKVRIFSAKDVSLSSIFSMVCLILATCVSRSFRFCDNISSLACFSIFSRLICPYTTAFFHRYKWYHFLLLLTFWYLFGFVYQSLLILRCYLQAHPICFVGPYRSLKVLACRSQYFVMPLVF